MAFSATFLTQNVAGIGTSSTTASITGTSGNTILIYTTATAVSGASISGATNTGLSPGLWVATATGNPGALTLTRSIGTGQWAIVEITGGTSSVIQSASDTGTGTTAAASLTAAIQGTNLAIAYISTGSTAAITPKTGWTEILDRTDNNGFVDFRREIQFKVTGEQAASGTWAGSDNWSIVTSEIGTGTVGSSGAESLGMLPVGF